MTEHPAGLHIKASHEIAVHACWHIRSDGSRHEIPFRVTKTEDGYYLEPRGEVNLEDGHISFYWTE